MPTPTDSYNEIFSPLNRILVVLAHPDDMEITCGGLMARLAKDQKQLRLVVTTNGGKGMRGKSGLNEISFGNSRVKEQIAAGKILGIPDSENFNLNLPDGEVEQSFENIGKIAYHIRQFKPDLVITHRPEDAIINFLDRSSWVNHRDHRHTALLTLDAVYPYSRDRGFYPEHFDSGLEPHTVNKLLLADSYLKPEVKYFAIDTVLQEKKLALQTHTTAFDPADADEYLSENKFSQGYFEPLGYYEIY